MGGAGGSDGPDLFNECVNKALMEFDSFTHEAKGNQEMIARIYVPIVCNADTLLSLKREEIFCLRPRLEISLKDDTDKDAILNKFPSENTQGSVRYSPDGRGAQYCRFFRNMLPDTCPIAVSQVAGRFFLEEEFELELLREGMCPFGRSTQDESPDYGHL